MRKILNYLKKTGFKKIKVPSGIPPNTMNRWICSKVPYSSAISEFRIKEIVNIAKKEVFEDVELLSRPLAGDFGETPIYKDYQKLKKKHLSSMGRE